MSKNICPIIRWSYLLLTTWNSPSWEEVTQLVKKCSAFYGTEQFITVFIRGCNWTKSRATRIHSAPSHPISFISTPSYHLSFTSPSFGSSNQNVFLLPNSGSFVDPCLILNKALIDLNNWTWLSRLGRHTAKHTYEYLVSQAKMHNSF
jgi:hypothetical protein